MKPLALAKGSSPMAIDSVIVSSVELSEGNVPNPFTRDDIYLD